MGANAQTSVPTFTAGEILTAANMNISARTGIPVFADSTARDAAFGGTGEKTLAEGQFAYIENIAGSAATQYYDGSSWQTLVVGGLTLISATTIGTAVSSVTVSNAFSATYDVYKITLSGGAGSTLDTELNLTLGATATAYYYGQAGVNYVGATATNISGSNTTSWVSVGRVLHDGLQANFDLNGPFLSKNTFITGAIANENSARSFAGRLQNTTSYTAFTLTAAAGTLTGGIIRVYGYQNS